MRGGMKALEIGYVEQEGSIEQSKRMIVTPSPIDRIAEMLLV